MTQIDELSELMNDVESMSFLEGKVFCKKCNAPDHPDNMNALGLCMNCISVITKELDSYSNKNKGYLEEAEKAKAELVGLKTITNLKINK